MDVARFARSHTRRGINAARERENEEETVQALPNYVNDAPPSVYILPESFDARAAVSRLALLGLARLNPRRLADGTKVDVPALIEQNGRRAFRRIWTGRSAGAVASNPANRIFLPGTGSARADLEQYVKGTPEEEVLRSHGISPAAANALRRDDVEDFVTRRAKVLEETVRETTRRLAGWEHSDRPSISHLLERSA